MERFNLKLLLGFFGIVDYDFLLGFHKFNIADPT